MKGSWHSCLISKQRLGFSFKHFIKIILALPWKAPASKALMRLLLSHKYLGGRVKLNALFGIEIIKFWSRRTVSKCVNWDIWRGTRVNKFLFKLILLTGLTDGLVKKTSRISLTRTSPKKLKEQLSDTVVPSPASSTEHPQGS